MLKPLEVYSKKFEKSFRGYEEEKVDAFLLQVAKDYESLYEESMQLKEDAEITKGKLEHYQQLEKTMQNALMIAQTTAEEIIAKANNDKENVINDAKEKAQQILNDIETSANARKDELNGEIEDKNRELAYVQSNIQICFDKMKYFLENQLRILSDDDFAKEMAQIVVDVSLFKKEEPVLEEAIEEEAAVDGEEQATEGEEVSESVDTSEVDNENEKVNEEEQENKSE